MEITGPEEKTMDQDLLRRVLCGLIGLGLCAFGHGTTGLAISPLLPGKQLASVPPFASPGARRAVLIGIDDYSASRIPRSSGANAVPPRGLRDLEGAINDVGSVQEMLLSRYGFDRENVLTLTDQKATREAILRAVEEHLVRPAKKGDTLLFYYSGHGSQVANPLSDEADYLDESIVPADVRLGALVIRDKELRRLFNRALDREASLTVILDSCHSGSGARGLLTGARFRGIKPDLKGVEDGSSAGPRPEDRGALVFAATQDSDLAWETEDENGQPHGAFSLALTRAIRSSPDGEPAEEIFLRARALLQAEKRFQEPVLAGIAAMRQAPLLGVGARRQGARKVVAIEGIAKDGTVILQGGWASGLTVGSELRVVEAGSGPEARLQITAMKDLVRCEARLVAPVGRSVSAILRPGMLAEVVGWAAPPGAPLRVHVPSMVALDSAVLAIQELAREASRRGIRWIEDPTEEAPTHVLRWREQGWELLDTAGDVERLGPMVSTESIFAKLPSTHAALFVQIPSPAALARGFAFGPGPSSGIEMTDRPEEADYILAGRLAAGSPEYAWMRSDTSRRDRQRTGLPVRTAWRSLEVRGADGALRETTLALEDAVLRLRTIHAWQHLDSPPDDAFPYELILRNARMDRLVTDGILSGEENYQLLLRAKRTPPPDGVAPRYIYVFLIDSSGRSVLLYPTSGSVENRFPWPKYSSPAEIPLGRQASLRVTAPYGVDTYFLLTSEDPLANPWILEWDSVRTRVPQGKTPLEELLSVTGGSMRSEIRPLIPAAWSLDRKLFESVPPAPSPNPVH